MDYEFDCLENVRCWSCSKKDCFIRDVLFRLPDEIFYSIVFNLFNDLVAADFRMGLPILSSINEEQIFIATLITSRAQTYSLPINF